VVAYCASLGPQEHGVIPCAVLLHLAEHDEWIDDQRPEAFIGRLREHGTPVTSHTYPGTSPVFPNASLRDRLDPDAAALAYRRTEAFLAEHLGNAS
jgi:carboxymethylenebutenolidase